VGVSADIKKDDVEKFIKDAKYFDCTFPLAFDPNNSARDAFKAMQGKNGVQTPCLFLFDATGKCVWTERFSKAANWSSVPTPQQSAEQIRRFLAGEALIDNGETEIAAVDEEEAADLFASVAGDGEW
jgi:peroxiredoxin